VVASYQLVEPAMHRNTRQREAIRRVFRDARHPLAPNQVHRAATRYAPGIGIATVYRTLNLLVETAWLVRIRIPGNRSFYERSGQDHHHHFLCRSCERLYRVAGCLGEVETLAPRGSQVESHDLLLHGQCGLCRRPRRRTRRRKR
jgi:Fur family ferric uptake transcriptional regulator